MNPPPKLIVLTGATRGLGRALVPLFVRDGHVVVGCGRSEAHVATLKAEFPDPHGFKAVDVRDAEAVRKWAKRVVADYGPPDLLINNAAVVNNPGSLWTIPEDEFHTVIDVNINGVFHVIRAFVPHMVKAGTGVIVNLSSGWGRSTSPDVAPYCATKYAIEGLTLALAKELPKGMAAVPLNPGIIDTDMLRQCWADGAASFPKADDWAKRAAPFLLNLGAKDNGKSLTVA